MLEARQATTAIHTEDLSTRKVADWTSSEIDNEYRRIQRAAPAPALRVAWLANHTIDATVRAATVFASLHEVTPENSIAPYNQQFQVLLDPDSDILREGPDAVVLALSLRMLAPRLVGEGEPVTTDEVAAEIDRVFDQVAGCVAAAKNNTAAHIILCNFPKPPTPRLGLADSSRAEGDLAVYADLNSRLTRSFADDPRVTVADVDHALAASGVTHSWDPRLYRLAKVEWSGTGATAAGALLARILRALIKPAKKCIVLDLDNTLWGGVLGEEGPGGIRIDEGDPVGESFRAFQWALKQLKARGILLAICSKNNQADVDELFDDPARMPLKRSDFAAVKINWETKHTNIAALAAELNIGTDSLVFIDDNPAECSLIRQMLPDVHTVLLPEDPADFAELVLDMPHFDKLRLTEEDSSKTEQYAANAARQVRLAEAGDLTTYLESLGTRLTIQPADTSNLTRLHQLFSKTNQFNVTTIRYSPSEIETFIRSPEFVMGIARASDNFGELGIIGTYLLRLADEEAEIDSFVLSCRALGRGIEAALCNHVKQLVFESLNKKVLKARFVPTKRNVPAATFYRDQGFRLIEENEEDGSTYQLECSRFELMPAPGIEVITTGERNDH